MTHILHRHEIKELWAPKINIFKHVIGAKPALCAWRIWNNICKHNIVILHVVLWVVFLISVQLCLDYPIHNYYHPSQCKCWITSPNNLFSISWSESCFFIDVVLYNFFCVRISLSSNSFQFMEFKIHESLFLCWLACCGNVVGVVCYMVHNGRHCVLEHLQMFVLLKFYIICRSMFGVLSCHKFLNLLTVFCHPPIPWLCFLYDPSPISVPRALFICYHSKFFLKTFNPSSHSIPVPFFLNQQS
jgi:hypothetical protein